MKRLSVIHLFVIFVGLALLVGVNFETTIEAVIADVLAPRVFLSAVVVVVCFVLYLAAEPLFERRRDKSSREVELLAIVSAAVMLSAYSSSRLVDRLARDDVGFVLTRYVRHINNKVVGDELQRLQEQVTALGRGTVSVRGLENIEFRLRDYWRTLDATEGGFVLVLDGQFEHGARVGELLRFVATFGRAAGAGSNGGPRAIGIARQGVAQNEAVQLSPRWGLPVDIVSAVDSVSLPPTVETFTRKHYQTLFGWIGAADCVFVVSPANQDGTEFDAVFHLDRGESEFLEIQRTVADARRLVASHSR
jgi:hypothetical protein